MNRQFREFRVGRGQVVKNSGDGARDSGHKINSPEAAAFNKCLMLISILIFLATTLSMNTVHASTENGLAGSFSEGMPLMDNVFNFDESSKDMQQVIKDALPASGDDKGANIYDKLNESAASKGREESSSSDLLKDIPSPDELSAGNESNEEVLLAQAGVGEPPSGNEVGDDYVLKHWALGPVMISPSGNSGAAVTSISITVPPGIKGMQPNLSLSYNSSARYGWIGVGWNLSMGSIQRNTKWGLDYSTASQDFVSGGAELVRRSDWDPVGGGKDCYGAKIEGAFSRYCYVSSEDRWEVTTKDGSKYFYGTTSSSRIYDPDNEARVFKWNLDKVVDTNSNYMTVSYWRDPGDPDNGEIYLNEIRYTGNGVTGLQPKMSIRFYREDRTDHILSYSSQFMVETAYRLKTIEVKVNDVPVRAYTLSYQESGTTSHSLLSVIEQYGNDGGMSIDTDGIVTGGSQMPPITLSYTQEGDGGFYGVPNNVGDWQEYLYFSTGDFNGDGWTDWSWYNSNNLNVMLSTGDGHFENRDNNTSAWDLNNVKHFRSGDFDGDGLTDFSWYREWDNGKFYVMFSNGDGHFHTEERYIGADWQTVKHFSVGDFDGDGDTDWSFFRDLGEFVVLLSDRQGGFTTVITPGLPQNWQDGNHFRTGDFNGDGYTDWSFHLANTFYVLISDGEGGFDTVGNSTDGWNWDRVKHFNVGDFNGDGMTDWSWYTELNPTNMYVMLSTGDGHFERVENSNVGDWQEAKAFSVGDFNGDGLTDWSFYNEGYFNVKLSAGDGTFVSVYNPPGWNWDRQKHFRTGDFNGDGKTDWSWYTEFDNYKFYVMLANPSPDETPSMLLNTISNGIGATTTLEYLPSSEYDNIKLPFIAQTLSSVTINDGNGIESITGYDYSGGYYDYEDREYRGFQYVTSTAPNNTYTTTEFLQDNICKGLVKEAFTKDIGDNFYARSVNTYLYDCDFPEADFYLPQLIQKDDYAYDGKPASKHAITQYWYDDYGNITRNYFLGDSDITGDERNEYIAYYDPDEIGDGITGLPKTSYVTDSDGFTIAQEWYTYYGGTGNMHTKETWNDSGANPVVTYEEYDPYGNAVMISDPRGYVTTTTFEYLADYMQITSVNSLGHTGISKVDYAFGKVLETTDMNGQITINKYDEFGRAFKTIGPKDSVAYPSIEYIYPVLSDYGQIGVQKVIVRAREEHGQAGTLDSAAYFDGLGRTIMTRTEGPTEGAIQKFIIAEREYNDSGLLRKEYIQYFEGQARGDFTEYFYDPIGRTQTVTFPDLTTATSIYDKGTIMYVDTNGHAKMEIKDIYGRLVEVREYTGIYPDVELYATTKYGYDGAGNLEYIRDAHGNETYLTYDTLSRKLSIYDPDMGLWEYEYDPNGNLIMQTDAKDQVLRFEYDELNRIHRKIYPDNSSIDYTYDEQLSIDTYPVGRLTTLSDNAGTTKYYYNEIGNTWKTEKIIASTLYITETTYDALGRQVTLTYPDTPATEVRYWYGTGGNLERVTDSTGAYEYAVYSGINAMGQIGRIDFGNGMVIEYTYYDESELLQQDRNNRLKQIITRTEGGTEYLNLFYEYDSVGNIKKITDNIDSTKTRTYVYDDLDRLIEADTTVGSSEGAYGGKLLYQYDKIGNITYNCRYGHYFYDDVNHTHAATRIENGDGSVVDSYIYDLNGSMTFGAGRTIAYNYDNRAESIQINGNAVISVYDVSGQRVRKMATVSGDTRITTYIGDIYECTDGDCTKYVFAGSQRIAKVKDSGEKFFFHSDHLGSTNIVTDESPELPENQQNTFYYPYGAILSDEGPASETGYKFTDQEWDAETGLYYYGARYYDPKLGRFISADTIVPNFADPQSLNRYSYVLNNPLKYIDPSGHDLVTTIVICIVVGAVSGAVSAGIQSDWDSSAMWKGAAAGAAGGAVGGAVGGVVGAAVGATYGEVAGGIAGGIAGGASGGAVGSAVYTAMSGGSSSDIKKAALRGAIVGAIAGGIGGYIQATGINPYYKGLLQVGAGAVVGGVAAEAYGGDFGQGALMGAIGAVVAMASHPYAQYLVNKFFEVTTKVGYYFRKIYNDIMTNLGVLSENQTLASCLAYCQKHYNGDAFFYKDGQDSYTASERAEMLKSFKDAVILFLKGYVLYKSSPQGGSHPDFDMNDYQNYENIFNPPTRPKPGSPGPIRYFYNVTT